MPQLFQGDIFEAVFGFDLAIVFGHLGFNEMKGMWDRFRDRTAAPVANPFVEYARKPLELEGRWFWFVPVGANYGMEDGQVKLELDRAISSAEAHFGRSITIITNGIAESGDEANDERRARFLSEIARGFEGRGHRVSLISLNDVFVRLLKSGEDHNA